MRVVRTTDPTEALKIRWRVFVEEQGVPVEDELDGTDEGCLHWLLFHDDVPVSTLRSRSTDDAMSIGRVATLRDHRGKGHGKRLMQAAIDHARANALGRVELGAQVAVIPWYQAMGFKPVGSIYDDAGIPHRDMILRL